MKNYRGIIFPGLMLIVLINLFSSCTMAPKRYLGDKALPDERIELKSTEEQQIWATKDLSIHYSHLDRGNFFDFSGYVEISTSVTYTFPLADYLYIYVYQPDSEGVATGRHSVHPNISKYNAVPDKAPFRTTLPKDPETASIAFGYLGNFISIEREEDGRMGGYEKIGWDIYHDPFQ